MARPLRLQYPGALYHVTARGNARQPIYTDVRDRQQFLTVVAAVVERFDWRCYAYCLMENHYHLLIETPRGNLSVGMRQLNGVYTQRFNRRHGRVGHVFQGRFKAIVVERERYLLALCRYVVLNPVRAGVVRQPERYRWSSYQATAGLAPAPAWLNREWILAQFSTRRVVAERQYQQFVHAGNSMPSPWEQVRGQVVLGAETFVAELQPLLASTKASKEIPQAQLFLQRPALEELLSPGQWQTRVERDQAIGVAHSEHGYSLSAIGRQLGLHYSTISKIVQKGDDKSQFKT